jgi:chorismate lyase/3-hydroxybenzoate synthase
MSRAIVQTPRPAHARFDRRPLPLPAWVANVGQLKLPKWPRASEEEIQFQISPGNCCALVSARLVGTSELSRDDFRRAVAKMYTALFARLDSLESSHPVRFWNFLPSIRQDMGDGQDRYMVFNAGRFAAFEARYGGKAAFDQQVATASAIGQDHPDLFIHCLSSIQPGRHLANPRQIAPYRYSPKFGPLPPCFARASIASIAGNTSQLLIGGTASIRGEESLHDGDLPRQIDETLRNLSSVVQAAKLDESNPLACFRQLRAYHPRPADETELQKQIRAHFPNVARPEILRADLCRGELLVEIEGVAELTIPA